ncbi:MAG TPA: type II toxin-antitoxin system VapC family toxin [Candidatus Limnocylindrales bacterium]|nr:type II toxin-antitoxin system VapC family toxin [Candidatus Limnocylindrales bacterium]
MNFLLDTNVVSEWVKPRPNVNVVRWLADSDEDRVYLSVITFAEIHHGIEEMHAGRRRDALISWLHDDLAARFGDRVLDVNMLVAKTLGAVMAQSRLKGVNLGVSDGFIAATAISHELTLVTRNKKHFERLNLPVLNPWREME